MRNNIRCLKNILLSCAILWISLFIILSGIEYYLEKQKLISIESISYIVLDNLIKNLIIISILFFVLKKNNGINFFLRYNFNRNIGYLIILLCISLGFFFSVLSGPILEFSSQYLPTFNFENYYDSLNIISENLFYKVVYIFFAGFLTGIAEEFFFRGFCYTFSRKNYSMGFSLLINTIIFWVFHPIPAMLPMIFILNIAFCLSLEYTKSLVAPICIHILFNVTSILESF